MSGVSPRSNGRDGTRTRVSARIRSVRRWWWRCTVPSTWGLPNPRVLGGGLALLAIVFVALVATAINGTSSGAFHVLVSTSPDPALLLGQPNMIRTDEWNVQTVWAISQFQQGLPAVSGTFPGGMDATIPQDLPRLDWTVAFRPHLWGFMLFDLDHAQAWKWWLPVFGLAATAYAFAVSLLPRRPITAMAVAIAFTASPFFAWWLLQTTLWPAAWGFAVLAAAVWLSRSRSKVSLWVWPTVIAYLTVVMAMGIYVPFIVPIAVVAALIVIGIGIEAARDRGWPTVLRRLGSLIVAGAAAGVVMVIWLMTRWSTVTDFLSTAYPGERLEVTGRAASAEGVAALFGSSFTNALRHAGTFLDSNASESATFFLPGAFLGVVVLWLVIRDRRDRRGLPWGLLLGYMGIVILLAFTFFPGWDAVAHLLFLDRSTAGRVRIGLGFGAAAIVIMLLARISPARRPGWIVSAAGPVVYLASQVAIAIGLSVLAPELLAASGVWWLYAALGAVVILAVARGWHWVAASGLIIISVAATYAINPVYVGVFDLRSTTVAQAIMQLDDTSSGQWVGVGDRLTTALLLETGVSAFNGFQGAPGDEMWQLIDPSGEYEYEWNRLAGVSWVAGDGEPVVSNPYPDQIQVTFDACSDFAQENVEYVLSDSTQVPSTECLVPVQAFDVSSTELTVWEVVPEQ